jgi:hypothetical protein
LALRFALRFVDRFAAGFAVRFTADFTADFAADFTADFAVRVAERAAVIVDRVAFSAAFPMARGEVICFARSASCAIPSTPAAKPRPTTVAPDSMMLPTVCADCSIAASLLLSSAVVSFAISPPYT